MENFKSFGKKLTVPFFPGFTAITGPNGSGKSNIADAILFVLGPKSSKAMRAGRLTDLIFNGGKKHKNPAKYCKVSLVFDNRQRRMPIDADEVTLTRMIKRAPLKNDPDNYYTYYYINGKACTYTEFNNVLTHARISGDGYNIVQQGDVTNLIEMGGVDRRRIIDDIAGISNFDNDIKKAEKEKEEVDSNLERIGIILHEITTQLRQLKKDRDEAFRYKELKDQLYEIKTKIALKKKQEVEKQIAEINQQIQSYEHEQKTLTQKAAALKETYVSKQKELQELEQKIADVGGDEVEEIKEQIYSLRREEIKIEERINYANDEIQELQNNREDYSTRLHEIEKELTDYETQRQQIITQIQTQQETLAEKETQLAQLKETIAASDDKSMDLTCELAKMREEYDEKNSQLHELKLEFDRLTKQIETIDHHLAELEETRSTYEFELKDIDWQTTEIKKERHEKTKKIKKLETQLFEKKKLETELTQQLSELDQAIRRLQQQQSKLQAEYDAYQMVSKKYNPAVTEVLKARDSGVLTGVHGTIAELAHVEKPYKTALAVAAGSRLQSIIVDDDKAAADAIRFLQRKQLGRATFLPLNKMIPGRPRGKALLAVKDEHAHGFAIDLVDFDERYRSAFWYVFGDTIVVDSLDDARRLMGGVRLVDLQGTLIEASGAMRGGSIPKTQPSFEEIDRKELEAVTQKLRQALSSQEELSAQLLSVKQEFAELEQTIQTLRLEEPNTPQLKDLDLQRKEFTKKLDILREQVTKKTEEKNTLESRLNEITAAIDEITSYLEELDKRKEEKGKLLLQGTTKQDAQQMRLLEDEVKTLQGSVLSLSSEKDAIEKKIELLNERKEEILGEIRAIAENIEKYKTMIEESRDSRKSYQDQIQALAHVQEQMTGKIKEFTTRRDALYKEIVAIENDLDKINTRIESYYDLISRAKYRLPTLEDTVKELEEEMKLYGVEVTVDALPSVESLKDSMKVIEDSMRELEPVNMRALEEYEHQAARKNKLDEDIRHLKEQRKNLVKLVNEVTAKKEERFYEVFNEINKNFRKIYAELSEGGEAELILENPEHPFESGLTIKARPRGKKILLLSALSGGEKSIASLAFIFAIQQYDPSPFYVLDEVDMFLDGVNAETVSRMVKQNAMDSQFIMVSLRKIALKEANHVYGVTMRDDGISDMIGNVDPKTVGPQGEFLIPGG